MKNRLAAVVLIALVQLAGCGGGGGSNTPPPPTYTIGGTITSLTGAGLVLQLKGGSKLSGKPQSTAVTFATQPSKGGPDAPRGLTHARKPHQTRTRHNRP